MGNTSCAISKDYLQSGCWDENLPQRELLVFIVGVLPYVRRHFTNRLPWIEQIGGGGGIYNKKNIYIFILDNACDLKHSCGILENNSTICGNEWLKQSWSLNRLPVGSVANLYGRIRTIQNYAWKNYKWKKKYIYVSLVTLRSNFKTP